MKVAKFMLPTVTHCSNTHVETQITHEDQNREVIYAYERNDLLKGFVHVSSSVI
jgi:hypothetical protein